MSANVSPFERSARAAKLAKLLDAAGIAESWKNATAAHFQALIRRAGVRPPSAVTMVEFFDALDERARAVVS